jgi:hypothetical protein
VSTFEMGRPKRFVGSPSTGINGSREDPRLESNRFDLATRTGPIFVPSSSS